MRLEKGTLGLLAEALEEMEKGFLDLPEAQEEADPERLRPVLMEAARRLRDNYPYFHPLYAGQMLKPPHPLARAAYMLAMWVNPNNHALDGGRASSAMEKEAVAQLAAMFGWETHLGHLTGGGTLANLEALWVAGRLAPGRKVAASDQAHYTHSRLSEVLGIPFVSVPADGRGRMDPAALARILDEHDVGTVVATVGTTGVGAVDPLADILKLRERHGFRLHADAAYGGYFTLAGNLDPGTRASYDLLDQADSIVVDPHKHGLQPYGCGCILFRDPEVGRFYKHDSPYTYFSSAELHLGEISLECSRAGAAAVALWATQRLMPPIPRGELAEGLEKGRSAALELFRRLETDSRYLVMFPPELDIIVWAPRAGKASLISELSRRIFDAAARENLHLALFGYPAARLAQAWPGVEMDAEQVICLRSVLMKPEHLDWVDRIWEILDRLAPEAGR